LDHLSITKNAANSLLVNYNSQAIIAYTKDLKYHDKIKYIVTKYNFVNDMVSMKEGKLTVHIYDKIIANPMMKSVPRNVFYDHVKSLGLRKD